MSDTIEFSIDFMTPAKTIGMLKEEIKKHLEANTLWHPNHLVVVREIENVNKLKMALFCNHTMNFQDFREKNRRRTELVLELKRIFEELGKHLHFIPFIHDVTITIRLMFRYMLFDSFAFEMKMVRMKWADSVTGA
ncbi:hypothetical protein V6N13_118908 [Hibiscus sabdariffa]